MSDRMEPYRAPAFWAKVDILGADECWAWTASRNRYGYGQFRLGGAGSRNALAHRIAYEELVGPIPAGLQIDHLCRNRACVNPAHLEPVTSRVNTLRGESCQARNARKTACPAGHPLAGDNLLVSGGARVCRACKRDKSRARPAALKAEYTRRWRERRLMSPAKED